MERRTLLKALSVTGFVALGSGSVLRQIHLNSQLQESFGMGALQGQWAASNLQYGMEDILPTELSQALSAVHQQAAAQAAASGQNDAQTRIRYFESVFDDDYFLPADKHDVMMAAYQRLDRVQSYVGHGNFNLLSFDDALRFARNYSEIGAFTQAELDFLDELYHTDARLYGFYGERVMDTLTASISRKDVIGVGRTGHFLFKGKSEAFYDRLLKEVGDDLVLTSGVRSMVKQMHLFLAKTEQSAGNLSKASRSLAPPGHSYHAVGDFDVGKVGFGYRNFTDDFADTDVYKRLQDLGFVEIRYTTDNNYGVRYEPWHIQVT
ncbi:M15 family metallopeptidase [Marinospirillum alkaliphilum]|uniref:D-alanyl-D-alanine carboxypeptidase n=1 Tax=Marinospirillum alkaliphilum DSM 21637 TaxID=1122209 RepID=A0A1K1U0T1_9GAMM|nr:M15 family metallopeptidase [Marinospirillum alkaliphilum]SFX06503.1 D-alanyl-D-alanine carboxypeptidase [Marinospirillum alkaliphilum DSM 21637]